MDALMTELFDVTNEFVEGAPLGLLVALIPYFFVIVGVVAGRWAKAWIGPFFLLYGGVFLQIYRKVFGTYEINIVWLVVSIVFVCVSFINLQSIKRPTINYINDTLYVGDLVTLLVFGAFLGYGVLKITSPEENVSFLPCILIAMVITAITVFLYETVTTIFVTAAGSSGLLLAINQLSYYDSYEEALDKTFLFSLFLKVFIAGAVLQTVIFVISSAKTVKDKKWQDEQERMQKKHEEELKKIEEEKKKEEERRIENERRATETIEGVVGAMSSSEMESFAAHVLEKAEVKRIEEEKERIASEERWKEYKAQQEAEAAKAAEAFQEYQRYLEREEEEYKYNEQRKFDEWKRKEMGW